MKTWKTMTSRTQSRLVKRNSHTRGDCSNHNEFEEKLEQAL